MSPPIAPRRRTLPFLGTGRYELLEPIGSGGIGVVYRVFDRSHGRVVALKTLGGLHGETLVRYRSVIDAVSALRHPNLPELYELEEVPGGAFLVMELVEGQALLDHVRPGQWDRARHTLLQVATALEGLHELGCVHGDVKPENILVCPSGRAVLLDLDLSFGRPADEPDPWGERIHTTAYAAPEQILGDPMDGRADLYAMGVVLYEMLTGQRPPERSGMWMDEPADPGTVVPLVPSDLRRLCVDLLRLYPGERPKLPHVIRRLGGEGAARPAAVVEAGERPVFVGREAQRRLLMEAFESIRAKRGQVLWIDGVSGIGKSSLLRAALCDITSAHGAVSVVRGRCLEGAEVPYKGVDDLVDSLCELLLSTSSDEIAGMLPEEMPYVRRAFPALNQVPAIAALPEPSAPIQDAKEVRRRVFAGLRALFHAVASRRYLVAMVEDLHWADEESWALLEALSKPPDEPPLLFVWTSRIELLDRGDRLARRVEEVLTGVDARRIRLEPLDPATSTELIYRTSGLGPEHQDILRQLVEEAGGHPLFLDALVNRRGNGWSRAGGTSLEKTLAEQIEAQPELAQKVIRYLAVAGRPLSPPELGHLVGAEPRSLRLVLDALDRERLLRRLRADRETSFDVYHDQIRQAVVGKLDPAERAIAHADLARVLSTYRTDPEVLMLHHGEAGLYDEALRHGREAARRAAEASAFEREARIYARILEWLPDTSANRGGILVERGDALRRCGRLIEAARCYTDARALVGSERALELGCRAAVALVSAGAADEGKRLLSEVARAVGLGVPKSPGATLVALIFARARIALSVRSEAVRQVRTPTAAERMRMDLAWASSNVFTLLDPVLGGYLAACFARDALRLGSTDDQAMALALEGVARTYMGEVDLGARLLGRAEERLGAESAPVARSHVAMGRAAAENILLADADRILEAASACLRAVSQVKDPDPWTRWATRLIELGGLSLAGRYRALESSGAAYTSEALQGDDRLGRLSILPDHHVTLRYLVTDHPEQLEPSVDEGLAAVPHDTWLFQHVQAVLSKLQRDLYLGHAERAVALLEREAPRIHSSMHMRMPVMRATYCSVEAGVRIAARTAGPSGKTVGRHAIRRSLRTLLASGRHYLGLAHALEGALRAQDGDPTASDELSIAIQIFDEGHFAGYAAAARYYRGSLIGGEEGERLRSQGLKFLIDEGVRVPERFARVLIPGMDLVVEARRPSRA